MRNQESGIRNRRKGKPNLGLRLGVKEGGQFEGDGAKAVKWQGETERRTDTLFPYSFPGDSSSFNIPLRSCHQMSLKPIETGFLLPVILVYIGENSPLLILVTLLVQVTE